MSDNSAIEWTDATWNPVSGCHKVSPGCDHCYAERVTERWHGKGSFERVVLHPERLDVPLRWRKPRRIFVNSMSDLFHDDVPAEFIADVFAVMALTEQHTYQVLTKRHSRMRSLLNSEPFWTQVGERVNIRYDSGQGEAPGWYWVGGKSRTNIIENVWLGVSVENQQWADIRIPALLETPAAVRFLSCEPLLGPIDLTFAADPEGFERESWLHFLDWVIVGGESGPGARPMDPDWARGLRDQCVEAGVPFLFKQWGEWAPKYALRSEHAFPPGPTVREEHVIADDQRGVIRLHRVGKKAAGRELDRRTWDEYPQPVGAP